MKITDLNEEEFFKEYLQDKFDNLKLTMELVPYSCWWSNVRSNVTRAQWDVIRKTTYKKSDYKCEICGGQGIKHPVECHEIWEYDEDRKIQILKGFVSLCPLCHEVKHFGLANKLGNGQRAMKRFKELNEISDYEANIFMRKFVSIHSERSAIDWDFDISLLSLKYGLDLNKTKFNKDDRQFFNEDDIKNKLERENLSRKGLNQNKNTGTEYTIDKDNFKCPYCNSVNFIKYGKTRTGLYRYKCKDCEKSFSTEIKTDRDSEHLKNLPNLFD